MATADDTVKPDAFERIADVYNDAAQRMIEKELPEALAELAAEKTYKNALRLQNVVEMIMGSIRTRISFRTHSDSWRQRHPDPGSAHDMG